MSQRGSLVGKGLESFGNTYLEEPSSSPMTSLILKPLLSHGSWPWGGCRCPWYCRVELRFLNSQKYLLHVYSCTNIWKCEKDLLRLYILLILQFFAEAGFPCPRQRNPSDHFLRCINSDFDAVNMTLMSSYRVSASEVLTTYEFVELKKFFGLPYPCFLLKFFAGKE